jgi:hypothetical protein
VHFRAGSLSADPLGGVLVSFSSPGSEPSADPLLEHLAADLERATTYHDHKETMAWTGTAASFGVLAISHFGAPFAGGTVGRVILATSCVALLGLAFVFVNMQFESRWLAADDIAALRRAKLRLLAGDVDFSTIPPPGELDGDDHASQYPPFVGIDNQASLTRRREALHRALDMLRTHGLDTELQSLSRRIRSELASYGTIVLVGVLAVLRIVLQHTA